MARFEPSAEQLVVGIKHVVYEFVNLLSAAHFSIRGQSPWRTHCDDAFLLGCRKLDDFLMRDNRSWKSGYELDDVLALDYLPHDSGCLERNWDLPMWKTSWRDPMNKQLTHIAFTRQKEWDHRIWVPQLEGEFRTAWWTFLDEVVDVEFSQEFAEQLVACQAREGFKDIVLLRT